MIPSIQQQRQKCVAQCMLLATTDKLGDEQQVIVYACYLCREQPALLSQKSKYRSLSVA